MDADSVGQSHLIEFPKLVLDWLVVKLDDEFLRVGVNTTDVTDITVENFFAVPSTAGEVTTASARCASFPQQEARSLTRQTRR